MGREPRLLFQQRHVAIMVWKEKFSGNALMARHLGTNCCLTCLFLLLIASLSFWGKGGPQSKSIRGLPGRQDWKGGTSEKRGAGAATVRPWPAYTAGWVLKLEGWVLGRVGGLWLGEGLMGYFKLL